eukprot:COSAG01_NODE_39893_length_470_cov_6.000000_2_plen_42_part_01
MLFTYKILVLGREALGGQLHPWGFQHTVLSQFMAELGPQGGL